MTRASAHSYTATHRLDLCQVKQWALADISCNLCVFVRGSADGFTGSAVIMRCMMGCD